MVDEVIKVGGCCLFGGYLVKGKGYYFELIIIDNVINDMVILC